MKVEGPAEVAQPLFRSVEPIVGRRRSGDHFLESGHCLGEVVAPVTGAG
jgi:hypothetical protein